MSRPEGWPWCACDQPMRSNPRIGVRCQRCKKYVCEPAAPGECDKCGADLPAEPIPVVFALGGFPTVCCSRACADYSRMEGRDDYGRPLLAEEVNSGPRESSPDEPRCPTHKTRLVVLDVGLTRDTLICSTPGCRYRTTRRNI